MVARSEGGSHLIQRWHDKKKTVSLSFIVRFYFSEQQNQTEPRELSRKERRVVIRQSKGMLRLKENFNLLQGLP